MTAKLVAEREDSAYALETDLIAALLTEPEALLAIRDRFDPADFTDLRHRLIYQGLAALVGERTIPTFSTLSDRLARMGALERAGGIAYLAELLGHPVIAAFAPHFAEQVSQHATLRRLVDAGAEIVRQGYQAETADDALAAAQAALDAVKARRPPSDGLVYAAAIPAVLGQLERVWADPTEIDVVATGLHALDRGLASGGFERGQLVIFAGRPGMAKTGFMLQVAHNIARREVATRQEPRWTVLFSSEMTTRQLLIRALAEASGIDSRAIRTGLGLTPEQRVLIRQRAERLAALPIYVDDRSRPTVRSMRAAAERLRIERPVRAIMFDYLEQAGEEGRSPSEELRISRAAAEMKAMAKDLDVTSIALSQINRAVEDRADKHPQLNDLRYSGRIEAEADVVLALYRQDYYENLDRLEPDQIDPEKRGACEIDVLKQREGGTGRYTVGFNPATTTFTNRD